MRAAATAVALLGCTSALASPAASATAAATSRAASRATRRRSTRARPRHGVSAAAAAEVIAGERRALEERGGRAGGLRDQAPAAPPATTSATSRGTRPSSPRTPSRAADDPTAIAYLGELDYGATAVSLPITNDAGLLQVSPGDGLTSLTRAPPGAPARGPRALLPDRQAHLRAHRADRPRARRSIWSRGSRAAGDRRFALVFDREIYGRELAAQVVARARRAGLRPVAVRGIPRPGRRHPGHRAPARREAARTPSSSSASRAAGRPAAGRDRRPAARRAAARRERHARTAGLALPAGPERIEAVGPGAAAASARATRRCGWCSTRSRRAARPPPRDRRRRGGSARDGGPGLALYRPGADGRFERAGTAP